MDFDYFVSTFRLIWSSVFQNMNFRLHIRN